ncbi:helix-turn-helix domain-containing protein [Streptomyces chrestomyceticus]|uniref:helix-turn-helix domain-containing protein n=1 Tax=Streptomyces chrestomyceticus TaxID=68185 RepID=UPI0037AD781A
MRSAAHQHAAAAGWDVARPPGPGRTAGVRIAGFRDRSAGPVEGPLFPHPAVTLVVAFGEGSLVVVDAGGRHQWGSFVAGLVTGAAGMRGEKVMCLEVRLSPVVTRAVLGVCPSELHGAMVALDDVWGRDAARIREQLGGATSWQERFALAEASLARRTATGPPVDPEVARAWDRIAASHGRVRIEELAAEVGWSRKRLWSRFGSQIGLPPKRAARLVRFGHAVHRLAVGEGPARVAAEAGYVDQSHLHRDVVAFTEVTPATVAAKPWLAADGLAWAPHGVSETD